MDFRRAALVWIAFLLGASAVFGVVQFLTVHSALERLGTEKLAPSITAVAAIRTFGPGIASSSAVAALVAGLHGRDGERPKLSDLAAALLLAVVVGPFVAAANNLLAAMTVAWFYGLGIRESIDGIAAMVTAEDFVFCVFATVPVGLLLALAVVTPLRTRLQSSRFGVVKKIVVALITARALMFLIDLGLSPFFDAPGDASSTESPLP